MTIAAQLTALESARIAVRDAVRAQGGTLPDGTPLADYAAAIAALDTGSPVALQEPMPPAILATSTGQQTTDTTSHPVTLPTHAAGDLLLVEFISDGAPTITYTSGWSLVAQISQSSNIRTNYIFLIASSASESLTITTSAAEQSAHIVRVIRGADRVELLGSTNGFSTATGVVTCRHSVQQGALLLWSCANRQNIVTASDPAGFAGLTSIAGTASSSGVSISGASVAAARPIQWTQPTTTVHSSSLQFVCAVLSVSGRTALAGWPWVAGVVQTGPSANSASHAVNVPAHVAGDRLVAIIGVASSDSASCSSGWTEHASVTSSHRMIVASLVAASSSESLTVTTNTRALSALVYCIKTPGDGVEIATATDAGSAEIPVLLPALQRSGPGPCLVLAAVATSPSTNVEGMHAPPAGFWLPASVRGLSGGGGLGVGAAIKYSDAGAVYPGPAWNTSAQRWTSATIALSQSGD